MRTDRPFLADLHEVGHNGDANNRGQLPVSLCLQWHLGHYAYLLDKLKSTPEGAGGVLDNSVVIFMPEAGHGRHLNSPTDTTPGATKQFLIYNTTSGTGVTWSVNGMAGGNAMNGTITAAGLYQRFLDTFDPTAVNIDACYPDDEQLRAYIRRIFRSIDPSGAMARECWSDYSKKLALWRQNRPQFEQFCAQWQEVHRPKLASLVRGPEIVKRILERAGAPLTCEALEPPISQKEYDFAVQNGHFIRVRFVLGDLLYFLGS